jgi:hypothetical protein
VSAPTDLSFLTAPGEIADWRMILLVDAVASCGALAALPGTAADLAARLELDGHALRVALDALVAWGVVVRGPDKTYVPGPHAPSADEKLIVRHHARALRAWATSLPGRLTGEAVEGASKMTDPEVFLDALAVNARKAAPGVVDMCLARFPDARRVVDLGGAHGEYALEFARRGLDATLQDLPTMVDIVGRRGHVAAAGVELFAGSFFDVVPPGPFDLAFCCGINHTFDGEHNQALFGRLRPVVAPGGGVAVVTFLRGRYPAGDIFAAQMLAVGHGGDTHSEEDYRAWLAAAGFRADDRAVDVADRPLSVLFAT